MSKYLPIAEHLTARCSHCGALAVVLGGRRIGPIWRNTQTGEHLCDDCYKELPADQK
jgi:hypothetical protein